jgi:two-component system CheB/CheR fusion protein
VTAHRVTFDGRRTGALDGATATNTAATDLTTIVDAVEVPIVVVRRDFRIAYFNKAAADVLGLSPSDMGRSPPDIPVLAGLPRLGQQCGEVISGGVETRADFRDGHEWFVVRISPHTTSDGQVAGTVLTFTNVTAFRESIDHAIYERECTKTILNTVRDPLLVLSVDQRIQSGNRAFYTMFGVSRDDAQGVPLYELGNGAFDLPPLRKHLRKLLAGSRAVQPIEVDQVATTKGERTLVLFPSRGTRSAGCS